MCYLSCLSSLTDPGPVKSAWNVFCSFPRPNLALLLFCNASCSLFLSLAACAGRHGLLVCVHIKHLCSSVLLEASLALQPISVLMLTRSLFWIFVFLVSRIISRLPERGFTAHMHATQTHIHPVVWNFTADRWKGRKTMHSYTRIPLFGVLYHMVPGDRGRLRSVVPRTMKHNRLPPPTIAPSQAEQ